MPVPAFPQRNAILRRMRALFIRQRSAFLSCLDLLDRQQGPISSQDAEGLAAHMHAQGLVSEELAALHKVAAALEEPYRRCFPGGDAAVEALREELAELRARALEANARNRGQLAAEMVRLQRRIQGLRLGRRVFSSQSREVPPSLIDIST